MRFHLAKTAGMIGFVFSVVGWEANLLAQDEKNVPGSPEPSRMILTLVEAHNKERSKEGLGPLKLDPKLVEAAKAHAKDMAEHDVMTHDGSDGSSSGQRITRADYHYLTAGENVAHGYRTVPEVMLAWMESSPHKKNILGDFTEIGLAVAYSEEGKPYWCAELAKPIPRFEPAEASADLIQKINDERAEGKKPLLTSDPHLCKAAQEQAEKLAKAKTPEERTASLDGVDPKRFPDVAMSTASGHPDAESMIKTLMTKPDMKAQLLGKYARIGTGYAIAENGTPFWCLILGNPKTVGRR